MSRLIDENERPTVVCLGWRLWLGLVHVEFEKVEQTINIEDSADGGAFVPVESGFVVLARWIFTAHPPLTRQFYSAW